jgi:hypothetical protein
MRKKRKCEKEKWNKEENIEEKNSTSKQFLLSNSLFTLPPASRPIAAKCLSL